jgi:hypothetical protein
MQIGLTCPEDLNFRLPSIVRIKHDDGARRIERDMPQPGRVQTPGLWQDCQRWAGLVDCERRCGAAASVKLQLERAVKVIKQSSRQSWSNRSLSVYSPILVRPSIRSVRFRPARRSGYASRALRVLEDRRAFNLPKSVCCESAVAKKPRLQHPSARDAAAPRRIPRRGRYAGFSFATAKPSRFGQALD